MAPIKPTIGLLMQAISGGIGRLENFAFSKCLLSATFGIKVILESHWDLALARYLEVTNTRLAFVII